MSVYRPFYCERKILYSRLVKICLRFHNSADARISSSGISCVGGFADQMNNRKRHLSNEGEIMMSTALGEHLWRESLSTESK